MKRILFAIPAAILFSCSGTKTAVNTVPAPPVVIVPVDTAMSSIDSLSYAMGVQTASYYKSQGAENINPEMVKKAYQDVYNNDSLKMTAEECNTTIQQKLQQYMAEKNTKAKEEGIKFLEENKQKPGVVTLPSGLQYEIIKQGTGPIPKATDTVKAHYAGSLIDGKEFDNSYKRGEPITIPVTGVIQGWVQALQLMPVGSKWKLFIPSDLGYGDRGAGGAIPGGAALIFEIELLEIVNK
ncbi:MAG: FKBP-type peptidyl-prolyl cis-trans isomerase [Ginsengibacter sp.]